MSVVLLTALTVTLLAALDLANDMQRQFETTLERAQTLQRVAARLVVRAMNSQLTAPDEEAWRDPTLADDLVDIMAASHAILEVAVVDGHNVILADSHPTLVGAVGRAGVSRHVVAREEELRQGVVFRRFQLAQQGIVIDAKGQGGIAALDPRLGVPGLDEVRRQHLPE